MQDDKKLSEGPELKAVFELSSGLRTTAFILCLIVLFTWIILDFYRPNVSNDDLFNATFTNSLARRLVETSNAAIEKTFQENLESFDYPMTQSRAPIFGSGHSQLRRMPCERF